MKLKLDKNGNAVLKNGHPVYTHSDGSESAHDAAGAMKALIEERFARSTYVTERLALPADIIASTFGQSFKLENGELIGYDATGRMTSRKNFGEPAGFDEALEQLVSQYPHKDAILKPGTSDSGVPGGDKKQGQGVGKAVYTRKAFDAMSPGAQMACVKGGCQVVD